MCVDDLVGITSPKGTQYVGVTCGAKTAWFSRALFAQGSKVFVPILAERGIHLVDKKDQDAFTVKLSHLSFAEIPVVEAPGWNGDVYALHDGSVFAADETASIPVMFKLMLDKNARQGTKDGWQSAISLLSNQLLGTFLVMMGFLGPLRRFMPHVPNFALEIVGPEGIGKSTLLQVVSSIHGGTGLNSSGRYWTSCAVGVDALSRAIGDHKDAVLILDDVNNLRADKKAIEKAYFLLGHDLGRAETTRGSLGQIGEMYRGAVLLAGNESLRAMAGKPPIAGDQIITLKIPAAWSHGVFSELPEGCGDGASFAEKLSHSVSENHGGAIRKFLRGLLADLKSDPVRFQERLDKLQMRFLKSANADSNHGKAFRTARAFAAIYAAGQLAKRYKVLPKSYDCKSAAIACYNLYALGEEVASFSDRLEALIASNDILPVSNRADALQSKLANEAMGTLHLKSTHREVRIDPAKIMSAFPDWAQIKASQEVKNLLVGEKGPRPQLKSKARLAQGLPSVRLFCFRLPLIKDESLFQPE
jgi:hypothetical protein